MTLRPLELICDSCGYRVCVEGNQLCNAALEGTGGFCTRDEWERRRVEQQQVGEGSR